MSNLEGAKQIMQGNEQENTELFLQLVKSLSPEIDQDLCDYLTMQKV